MYGFFAAAVAVGPREVVVFTSGLLFFASFLLVYFLLILKSDTSLLIPLLKARKNYYIFSKWLGSVEIPH